MSLIEFAQQVHAQLMVFLQSLILAQDAIAYHMRSDQGQQLGTQPTADNPGAAIPVTRQHIAGLLAEEPPAEKTLLIVIN